MDAHFPATQDDRSSAATDLIPASQLADQAAPTGADPVPAGRLRRATAWSIDYLLVIVPGLALVAVALVNLLHTLPAYIGAVAGEAGWDRVVRLFTHRSVAGVADTAAREWVAFALPLILAILVVPLFQFVYQVSFLVWRRRTIGMMIMDAGFVVARTGGRPRRWAGVTRSAVTTLGETGVVAVALVLMLVGQFKIGAALWAIVVVVFWVDALVAVGPGRRTITDRLAGVVAVRKDLYAAGARRTVATARNATIVAVGASRRGSELAASATRSAARAAVAAGGTAGDAAAVTGALAREGLEALTRSAPVQQVLDSRAAARAQAMGSEATAAARQLGEQATSHARRLGGRAHQLWRGRRHGSPDPHDQLPAPREGSTDEA